MKRFVAMLLILVTLLAAGCQRTDDAVGAPVDPPGATTDPEATPAPEDEGGDALPLIEATVAPAVALSDYQYEKYESDTYKLSFKHPSHWNPIVSEKDNIFAWSEPTAEGDLGAYMCVTVKKAGKIVVTQDVGMDKLTAFSKSLQKHLTDFKWKRGKRVKISGNTGFWGTYTCDMGGIPVKGYAALGYAPGSKRNMFVLFHFYCKAEDYKSYDAFRKTIIKSIRF